MSRNERRALIAAAAAIGLTMTPADAARLVEPTGYAEMRQLVEAHPEIERAIIPGLSAAPLLMGGKKAGLRVQDVFNISLWTGTGAARTITTGIDSGEGSLVWTKGRSVGYLHLLFDTVRGAQSYISSHATDPQYNTAGTLDAFSNAGYTLGTNAHVNSAGATYVGWQFRRAPKFFDIVQYTGDDVAGRQIAHNLGIKPGMIIAKRLDTTSNWAVYHLNPGATKYGWLQSSNAFADGGYWQSTEPTATHFTLGGTLNVNSNGSPYIAYLFAHDHSPEGVIQCGSYAGNGSATGPVVNLGWRPQYLLVKRVTGTGPWAISDAARNPENFTFANSSEAEFPMTGAIVFTASGFYPTANGAYPLNSAGAHYAYMAIREAA